MRVIYDKTDFTILGVISDRITKHLPPSFIGDRSSFIDFDFSDSALKKNHPLAKLLEDKKDDPHHFIRKLLQKEGDMFVFKDKHKDKGKV